MSPSGLLCGSRALAVGCAALVGLAEPMPTAPVVGSSRVFAATVDIYYAPEDRPADRLVGLYEKAHKQILVAVYGLTYPPLVRALVAAKKRGVDVRVITDREKVNDPKQRAALETLRLADIPIKINVHDGLMHLKQVVIDDGVHVSGSMNHTTSGNQYNDERLDVFTDIATTKKARDKFHSMWNDATRYEPWR